MERFTKREDFGKMSDMQLLLRRLIFGSIALPSTLLILCVATLSAQSLEIKLVDGRNGRPMVGKTSYVNVWVGPERKQAIAIPTDSNGVARLTLTRNNVEANTKHSAGSGSSTVVANPIVNYDEVLRINAPFAFCAPGGSNHSWLMQQSFSTRKLLEQGYVSPNTCGVATALAKVGQVVLFVRPLSWGERLRE
jgi:hypothetical protein